jgi:hypothetical protein
MELKKFSGIFLAQVVVKQYVAVDFLFPCEKNILKKVLEIFGRYVESL